MTPRILVVLLLGLLPLCLYGPARAQSLIPKPHHLERQEGAFVLDRNVRIVAPGDARSREIVAFARDAIARDVGIALAERGPRSGKVIELRLDPAVTGEEAYRLSVTPTRITLEASSHRGLFWAVQSLRQLLPLPRADTLTVPALRIEDAPRFGYRGHMLDVGRHFMPVEFVKKQIDLLSYYKLNTFRWHLTEDQGWRIQIQKYPKLTQVGAWRTEADGTRYGGYYTQAQIRDVVEYARLRNIMVIPEIELPGHSTAALASYPQLSCHKRPIEVSASWGVHKDIYCAGDETTFAFLQDVLDEVIALFPAPYLHIGGDEVPKDQWKDCASCQRRIRDEGLQDEHGLQSYFVKRIQRYLAGKGKTLIGWDEILEGGADRNAIIEVWRGDAEGGKALANGNRIISAGPFYLDSPTRSLTLEKVYNTDVVADPVYAAHRELVLGAEAPLWTEQVTPLNAEAMLYPRLQAFAETTWSSGPRDYADFKRRLEPHYRLMDAWQVGYGPEDKNLVEYRVAMNPQHTGWQLQAERGFDDLQLHYTVDGREPTGDSSTFNGTLEINAPGEVKVAPFRNGRPRARARAFAFVKNTALGKPIVYSQPPNQNYRKAGERVLVDGMLGSDSHHDGVWSGWQGVDLVATIDLQQPTTFASISTRFMQQAVSWILPPERVRFSISTDGKRWTRVLDTDLEVDPLDYKALVRDIGFTSAKPINARYIRVEVDKYGPLPAGHNGAGGEAFFFVDEIVIQ